MKFGVKMMLNGIVLMSALVFFPIMRDYLILSSNSCTIPLEVYEVYPIVRIWGFIFIASFIVRVGWFIKEEFLVVR